MSIKPPDSEDLVQGRVHITPRISAFVKALFGYAEVPLRDSPCVESSDLRIPQRSRPFVESASRADPRF
jgi:hypothetical protein